MRDHRPRTVITTLAAAAMCAAMAGLGFVWSGWYDVSATTPHWPATHWLLETMRSRSIQTHAAGQPVPAGFDGKDNVLAGLGHFAAHCAVCHGAPGVPRGEIARGLYPIPPSLAAASRRYNAAELFWIIKNGIKSTGMPAWTEHAETELWDIVAFVQALDGMSEPAYVALLMDSLQAGGGRHAH
jgi:mono/diheme cytochrome c family protein